MNFRIEKNWKDRLSTEFNLPYYQNLISFVKQEYDTYRCFPKEEDVFKAFNTCSYQDTKVVIIGQDPYHGYGQANGLCFSVNDGIPHPPSLKNIFKEIENDLNLKYPVSGNLLPWAQQGVLLLNATLTVREHQAGSHQKKGWEVFTNSVIKHLNNKKQPVVFLLWGGYAKKKKKLISNPQHFILEGGHPSPLSANRGYWYGKRHFSTTNSLLEQADLTPIDWQIL